MQTHAPDRNCAAIRQRGEFTHQHILCGATAPGASGGVAYASTVQANGAASCSSTGRMARRPWGTYGALCMVVLLFVLTGHQVPAAAIMFDLPPHTRECFFVKSQKQDAVLTGCAAPSLSHSPNS